VGTGTQKVLLIAKFLLNELLGKHTECDLGGFEVGLVDLCVEVEPVYFGPRRGLTRKLAHQPHGDGSLYALAVCLPILVKPQNPGWAICPQFFP
jgi:hypothetical protein